MAYRELVRPAGRRPRKDGLLEQGEIIDRLRKRRCQGLSAGMLNTWIRDHLLVPDLQEDRGDKTFHFYSVEAIPKIHRLYRYRVQRGFDIRSVRQMVALESHRPFYLDVARHPSGSTGKHYQVLSDVLDDVCQRFDKIVVVRRVSSLYGGAVDFEVLCECVDYTDLASFLGVVNEELQKRDASVSISIREIDPERHFFRPDFSKSSGEDGMRAYVLISAVRPTGDSDDFLKQFFKDLVRMPEVTSAAMVYGDTEMIISTEVANEQALSALVVNHIRSRPEIVGTKTYIVVHGYDYVREA